MDTFVTQRTAELFDALVKAGQERATSFMVKEPPDWSHCLHVRLTERFNQTLTTHQMKVVNSKANVWNQHGDEILLGYRVNIQESTKHSPFELLYRVKGKLPIDFDTTDDSCASQDVRVKDLLQAIFQLRHTAKEI